MKNLERVLKAVANKKRLAILAYLKQEHQATVGDIAAAIKLSFKATSKHLALLAGAEIVESQKQGLLVFYRLSPPSHRLIKDLLTLL